MKRGFTLIELLAVITIIGILVGIIIGVAGNVRKKAAVSRAKAEISAIELALERYKIDNADYPTGTAISIPTGANSFYAGSPTSGGYVSASQALFNALCGRANYSALAGAGDTIYLEVREGQVGNSSGSANSYLQDPFGFAYGYVYDPSGSPKSYYNEVVPDIWSTSGETTNPNSGTNNYIYLRWVTNWGSGR
ncbi:MAG: prepilin-type N-terminal cleavage/methylation domain-containing protein [Verrucomicrobiota bacterium]